MDSLVYNKVGFLAKALLTGPTLIGLLPRVNSFMNDEGGTVSVTFLTLITFVGPFTSMSSLVANKI